MSLPPRLWLALSLSSALGLAACGASPAGGETDGSDSQTTSGGASDGASSAPTSGITEGGSSGSADDSGSTPSASEGEQNLPEGEGCCEPHRGPGCNEPDVVDCVCAVDVACCGFDWTASCAEIAQGACEASCMAAVTGAGSDGSTGDVSGGGSTGDVSTTGASTTGSSATGDCCDIQSDAGCDDTVVQNCTCELDPYCCNTQWDDLCVQQAEESCMLTCP